MKVGDQQFCPLSDWECPYYHESGICLLDNPKEECDDFYAETGDE